MSSQTRKVLARAPDGACYVMDRERLLQLRGYAIVEDVPDEPGASSGSAGANLASLSGAPSVAPTPSSARDTSGGSSPSSGHGSGRRSKGEE